MLNRAAYSASGKPLRSSVVSNRGFRGLGFRARFWKGCTKFQGALMSVTSGFTVSIRFGFRSGAWCLIRLRCSGLWSIPCFCCGGRLPKNATNSFRKALPPKNLRNDLICACFLSRRSDVERFGRFCVQSCFPLAPHLEVSAWTSLNPENSLGFKVVPVFLVVV